MKTKRIIYWIITIVAAIPFVMGGIMDLMHHPDMVAGFKTIHYPESLLTLLGVAKLLGVIAILVPRLPRIKEWAYAGLTFDLIGAAWAHASVGEAFVAPIGILVILAASYVLYHLTVANEISTSLNQKPVLQYN